MADFNGVTIQAGMQIVLLFESEDSQPLEVLNVNSTSLVAASTKSGKQCQIEKEAIEYYLVVNNQ